MDTATTPIALDEVTIYRDARGIPHISSNTDAGAMYGLGYAAAEDRLAQMNLYVRHVQGRMAEIMGADHTDDDIQARLIGYWRHAQEVALLLPEEEQVLLQAYADGVNAWVTEHPEDLPPLFDILGFEPQTWTPAHSLAVWYRVANLFSGTPFDKARLYYDFKDLEAQVGTSAAVGATLDGIHPGDSDAAVIQASDVPQDVQDEITNYALSHGYGGANLLPNDYGHDTPKFSHAWVISGERTTTGKAVLVSDPQTEIAAPVIWYESQVTGATLNVRGIGVAGTPALLLGFNDHVAWGLTAAGLDQSDLFRLEMVDADHYQIDGVTATVESEVETIVVAGGEDVEVTWRSTSLGPIVTELLDGNRGDEWAMKGVPVHREDSDSFSGALAMMRAEDIDDVRAAVDSWHYPTANLVVGTDAGDIYFTVVGDIPLRSVDSPLGGMIGQEGGSAATDWADIIPERYRPWVLNPASGSILSANHRSVGDWYPMPLGLGSGGAGHTLRSARLTELVQALPGTVEPNQVLEDVQYDCVNRGRRDLVALARHVHSLRPGTFSPETVDFLDATAAWSAGGGSMETGVEAALLAYAIPINFRASEAGAVLISQYGGGQNGLNLFLDDLGARMAADPIFFPDAEVLAYLDLILSRAWDDTVTGRLDVAALDATYAEMASREIVQFGSGLTGLGVDVTGVTIQGPAAQCQDGGTIWSQQGQSYTHFVDFTQTALAVMPPGNSEDAEGEWFDNQHEDWAAGTLLPAMIAPEVPAGSLIPVHSSR